ncbi:Cofilin/tropomyosin-type actin-binding protein, partial [Ancylostoma duodenale]
EKFDPHPVGNWIIQLFCSSSSQNYYAIAVRYNSLLNEVIQASGVKIDPSCKNAYDLLHNKHQHSYIIFKIDKNDTAIVVEKVGDKGAPYSEFVEEMKKAVDGGKECRYAAVDVEVQVQRQGTEGGSKLNKVIFVQ